MTIYLVIALQRWGRGKTISEAFKNARVTPGDEFELQIFETDDEKNIFVDDMGGISFPNHSRKFKSEPQTLEFD